MLFEALAGSPPYTGAADVAKLVAKVAEPPPLVSQSVAGVSAEFDAIIATRWPATPTTAIARPASSAAPRSPPPVARR